MADPMRVRAQETGGIVDVKVLMKHDMETGQRKDSAGKTIPAHYITTITATYKGKQVFLGEFGPAVSKDPFLNFKFKGGAKGEEVTVSWVDNKNDNRTDKAKIS
ncbi:MAG: thiosulfate oxidation carrier complex protein SoxZ [Pseudomonadota bacterium]|jgi:sulfur-oxidizing protein SoxZ